MTNESGDRATELHDVLKLLANARDELSDLNQYENDDGALLEKIDAALTRSLRRQFPSGNRATEQAQYERAGLRGPTLNRDTLHDFVVAHGLGAPTEEAYALGQNLFDKRDDYATIAAEIVARGMTTEGE